MPNDDMPIEETPQEIGGSVNDNSIYPNDFVSEVQEESACSDRYSPNPSFAAQILASNEEVADDLAKRDKKLDINLKKIYGIGILIVLAGWVLFVILFSWKQLEPCECKVKHVSDTVFVALLTSATANILALPAIILKYLFPNKN